VAYWVARSAAPFDLANPTESIPATVTRDVTHERLCELGGNGADLMKKGNRKSPPFVIFFRAPDLVRSNHGKKLIAAFDSGIVPSIEEMPASTAGAQ
jgi:hypothetical protein